MRWITLVLSLFLLSGISMPISWAHADEIQEIVATEISAPETGDEKLIAENKTPLSTTEPSLELVSVPKTTKPAMKEIAIMDPIIIPMPAPTVGPEIKTIIEPPVIVMGNPQAGPPTQAVPVWESPCQLIPSGVKTTVAGTVSIGECSAATPTADLAEPETPTSSAATPAGHGRLFRRILLEEIPKPEPIPLEEIAAPSFISAPNPRGKTEDPRLDPKSVAYLEPENVSNATPARAVVQTNPLTGFISATNAPILGLIMLVVMGGLYLRYRK